MDESFLSILDRCLEEEHIPLEDCEVLLSQPEDSPESETKEEDAAPETDHSTEVAPQ